MVWGHRLKIIMTDRSSLHCNARLGFLKQSLNDVVFIWIWFIDKFNAKNHRMTDRSHFAAVTKYRRRTLQQKLRNALLAEELRSATQSLTMSDGPCDGVSSCQHWWLNYIMGLILIIFSIRKWNSIEICYCDLILSPKLLPAVGLCHISGEFIFQQDIVLLQNTAHNSIPT